MMPSFIGSAIAAELEGQRCKKCHWCDGWVWWPAESGLTTETRAAGRVFHDFGTCQVKEGEARKAGAS